MSGVGCVAGSRDGVGLAGLVKRGSQSSDGGEGTGVELHSSRRVKRNAPRHLNALQASPVYPVFEDEKSNGSDEKPVKRKNAQKDHRTNLIDKNIVSN